MKKQGWVGLLFILIFTSFPVVGQQADLEGIWHDTRAPDQYYVVRFNGDRMVMINLVHIELFGDSLSAAYIGKTSVPEQALLQADLRPIKKQSTLNSTVRAVFNSDMSLTLYECNEANFDDCVVGIIVELEKVF